MFPNYLNFYFNYKISGDTSARQPYFNNVKYRVAGELTMTDHVMSHTFWIGLYPGLRKEHLDFVIAKFHEFFKKLGLKY